MKFIQTLSRYLYDNAGGISIANIGIANPKTRCSAIPRLGERCDLSVIIPMKYGKEINVVDKRVLTQNYFTT